SFGLSRGMVSAIGPVHVSLSRRRVLREWRPRIGASPTRIVSVRLASARRRSVVDRSSALSHTAEYATRELLRRAGSVSKRPEVLARYPRILRSLTLAARQVSRGINHEMVANHHGLVRRPD